MRNSQGGSVRTISMLVTLAIVGVSAAAAQSSDPNTYSKGVQAQFQRVQDLIVRSAEKIDQDLYSFKPTPEIRSVAGVIGHVADGNNLLCRVAAGEKVDFEKLMKDFSAVQVHEKKTSKPEIIAALKESQGTCEAVFAKLTDESGREPVAWMGGRTMPKLMVLTMATGHAWEHYGNLVTYMRLKGIVPPSSERPPSNGQDE
jgi:uncharacterized damage-inducible protein DinB